MNAEPTWQTRNNEYLAVALKWLRLRLEWHATSRSTVTEASHTRAAAVLDSRGGTERASQPAALEEAAAAAAAAAEAAEGDEPPPALIVLGRLLGLSRFEREVLLLCAAMELDTRIPSLCTDVHGDVRLSYPTFALALTLFDEPTWDALSPRGPLRWWRLIEIAQHPGQPLVASAVRADERIVNFLKGLNCLDDRLEPLVTALDLPEDSGDLPPSQASVVASIMRRWGQAERGASPPIVHLLGPDTQSKQIIAVHAAARLGRQTYRLPSDLLPQAAGDLETIARLWHRESILLPIALYVDAHDEDGGQADARPQTVPVNRFLARSDGVFFLATHERRREVGRASHAVDVSRPTPAEQLQAWTSALEPVAAHIPELLASQFRLEQSAIRGIAHGARADLENGGAPGLAARLWDACRAITRPRLDALAERVESRATWADIVLPPDELQLLREIAAQVGQRNRVYEAWGFGDKTRRGLGINALFTGPSGTGKTMAAEVLANDLRLDLYRIDLSSVVSKYIGDTEKNLRRVFDGAEDGGALLFFDEADALFGKRSEVRDSHDRYANIEVNYLLQRMETYRGLAILSTNMKSALDTAFLRRLRFVVTFSFPSMAERRAIWDRTFPEKTPAVGLDFDRLSRLPATGGAIRNIAVNAAFAAAHEGTSVTMPLILRAARIEFRKLELPVHEADFTWQGAGGAQQ